MECYRQGKTKVLGEKPDKRETLHMKIHFVPLREHSVLPLEVEWAMLCGEIQVVGEKTCKKATVWKSV
jgi:hypothetical protein